MSEPILSEWFPPDYEKFPGELLMEFPENIMSLLVIGDRLYVTLDSGKVIECSELLGDPKH